MKLEKMASKLSMETTPWENCYIAVGKMGPVLCSSSTIGNRISCTNLKDGKSIQQNLKSDEEGFKAECWKCHLSSSYTWQNTEKKKLAKLCLKAHFRGNIEEAGLAGMKSKTSSLSCKNFQVRNNSLRVKIKSKVWLWYYLLRPQEDLHDISKMAE